jgi:hypothetical protein
MRYQAPSHRVIRPYAELLCRECNAFASVLQCFVNDAADRPVFPVGYGRT